MQEFFASTVFFWMFSTATAILIGCELYFHYSFRLKVTEHKLRLHQIDVTIARKYLQKHPQDLSDYVDEVQKAIQNIKP